MGSGEVGLHKKCVLSGESFANWGLVLPRSAELQDVKASKIQNEEDRTGTPRNAFHEVLPLPLAFLCLPSHDSLADVTSATLACSDAASQTGQLFPQLPSGIAPVPASWALSQ